MTVGTHGASMKVSAHGHAAGAFIDVKEPSMPDLEFPTSAGVAPGYLAVPADEHGPATIVLQEWWGVDAHIRSICDRFAAEGFFALAPDLYRGETTTQPSEAEQKMMALSMEEAEKDMCGAAEFLSSQPGFEGTGVGAVGFCLGGGLAVWAAATCPQIAAAVSYYYVMPHGKPDFAGISGPILGHFGTADAFIALAEAEALESELRSAGAEVTFHYYQDAGHAFFNDTNRLGTYDADAAESSWGRTVSFLRAALSPASS
jgi:carboxymethylenebutenolidase